MNYKEFAVLCLTYCSVIVFAANLVLNILATRGHYISNHTITEVTLKYPTLITTTGYRTNSALWTIALFWTCVWLFYAITGTCRRGIFGRVIFNPLVLTVPMQICWIVACACNICWVLVWSREELFVGFMLMLLCTISGIGCISFLVVATEEMERPTRKDSKVDVALIYIIIQNGVDILFSWTAVSTLVNLSVFLSYDPVMRPPMQASTACTISLSILLGIVWLRSVSENVAFYKHTRYLYAWYGVLITSCVEILLETSNVGDVNVILTIALICSSFFCLAVKGFVSLYRNRIVPSYDVDVALR